MKCFGVALIAAAVIVFATLGIRKIESVFSSGKNMESIIDGLQQHINALEAENRALVAEAQYMLAKNREAVKMAEDLLYYTRMAYPMESREIIAELASYQSALCALLDKLTEPLPEKLVPVVKE